MFPAGFLLSSTFAMVWVVELNHKSLYSTIFLLHSNEHSSCSIGQSVKGVQVMDQNHLGTNLQLEDCLKGCVANASSVVLGECLDCPTFIFCLDLTL